MIAAAAAAIFGLWRVRFPPILVRTARRLPVEALGERGVLVTVTGYTGTRVAGPQSGDPVSLTRSSRSRLFVTSLHPVTVVEVCVDIWWRRRGSH